MINFNKKRHNMVNKKFIRIIISVAIILYMLSKISFSEIWCILQNSRLDYLILAFSFIIMGVFISSLKWKLLLSTKSIKARYIELVRFYFIGMFFNSVMPSTIGGDMIRGYESSKEYGNKSKVFSSIFMERFTGLIALISFAIVGLFLEISKFCRTGVILILFILIGATIGIAILIYDKKNIKFFKCLYLPILNLFERFDLKDKSEEFYDAVNDYKNHRSVISTSLLLSFIFQFISISYTYIMALSLNININFTYFFIFVPIITCITMIPVSIGGLGIREVSYVYLFTKVGMTISEAFTISIMRFFLALVVSLIGGLIYLDRNRSIN